MRQFSVNINLDNPIMTDEFAESEVKEVARALRTVADAVERYGSLVRLPKMTAYAEVFIGTKLEGTL